MLIIDRYVAYETLAKYPTNWIPEADFLQVKRVLNDAGSGDTYTQDILLRR